MTTSFEHSARLEQRRIPVAGRRLGRQGFSRCSLALLAALIGAACTDGPTTLEPLSPPVIANPLIVPGPGYTQVNAGPFYTCAVKEDGILGCWGQNTNGQTLPPSLSYALVSTGSDHACGLTTSGTAA